MISQKRLLSGIVTPLIMVIVLLLSSSLFLTQSVHAASLSWQPGSKPLSFNTPSHITQAQAVNSPLPHWSSSFTYNGTVYPYTMLGTNPADGSVTTTLPVTIVPLKIVFSDGTVLDGSKQTTKTVNSPIFQPITFSSGFTQFGDAMMRAEFWTTVSKISPNYHVLLGTPTVASVVTINVPATYGSTQIYNGHVIGGIYFNWYQSQLLNLITSENFTPNMLPLFLLNNVLTYSNLNGTGCCWIGFHHVQSFNLQTFISSAYLTPGIYAGIQGTSTLSHEVAEWMNDPFLNNVVPNWYDAYDVSCQNLLEVGDPLSNISYKEKKGSTTYYLQDIAFFSWYARESPSQGIKGRYTYRGTFTTYSSPC